MLLGPILRVDSRDNDNGLDTKEATMEQVESLEGPTVATVGRAGVFASAKSEDRGVPRSLTHLKNSRQ